MLNPCNRTKRVLLTAGWLFACLLLHLSTTLADDDADARREAERLIAEAEKLRPDLVGYGNPTLAKMRKMEKAREGMIDLYSQAIELAPQYATPWRLRADLRGRSGDKSGAIDDLFKAKALEPGNSQTLLLLARIKGRRPLYRFDEEQRYAAEGVTLRKKELDEQGKKYYQDNELRELAFLARQWREVVALGDRALEDGTGKNDSFFLRWHRGLSLLALGEEQKAEADFAQAIKLAGSAPRMYTRAYYRSLDPALNATEIVELARSIHSSELPYAWLVYSRAIEKDPKLDAAYVGRASFSLQRRKALLSGRPPISPISKELAERYYSEQQIRDDYEAALNLGANFKEFRELRTELIKANLIDWRRPLPAVKRKQTYVRVPENATPALKQRLEAANERLTQMREKKDYAGIKTAWDELIAELPDVWSLRFDRYHAMNRLYDATKDRQYRDPKILLEDSLKILETMPKSTRGSTETAYSWATRSYARLDRLDEAMALTQEWVEEFPESSDALDRRAEFYLRLGRFEEALADWTAAKEGDKEVLELLRTATSEKDTLKARHARVDAAFRLGGDATRLRKDLTAALARLPESALLRAWRAAQWMGEGDYAAARTDLDEAIQANPHVAEVYAIRAVWRQANFQFDEALEDYAKAEELNYQLPEIYFRRAMLYYYLGRMDEAHEDFLRGRVVLDYKPATRRLMLPDRLARAIPIPDNRGPHPSLLANIARGKKSVATAAFVDMLRGNLVDAHEQFQTVFSENDPSAERTRTAALLGHARRSGRHALDNRWFVWPRRAFTVDGIGDKSAVGQQRRAKAQAWFKSRKTHATSLEDLLASPPVKILEPWEFPKSEDPNVGYLETKRQNAVAVASFLKRAIGIRTREFEDALYAKERGKLTGKVRQAMESAIKFDGAGALDHLRDVARGYPDVDEFKAWYAKFRENHALETTVEQVLAEPNADADAASREELRERCQISAAAALLAKRSTSSISPETRKEYIAQAVEALRRQYEATNDKPRHMKWRSQHCHYSVRGLCESFFLRQRPTVYDRYGSTLQFLLDLRGDSPIVWHLAATFAYHQKNYEDAVKGYTMSLQGDWEADFKWFSGIEGLPTPHATFFRRGLANNQLGKIEAALTDLGAAIKTARTDLDRLNSHFVRGYFLFGEGRDKEADEDFAEALEVARKMDREADMQQRIAQVKGPFEFDEPDKKEAHRLLRAGMALASRDEHEAAIAKYEQGLRLWAASGPLHMRHATALYNADRAEEGIAAATKAIEHLAGNKAEQAAAYGVRGGCKLRLGQADEAEADFQKQIKLSPNQRGWVANMKKVELERVEKKKGSR